MGKAGQPHSQPNQRMPTCSGYSFTRSSVIRSCSSAATSTPVGPPPTMTKDSSFLRSCGAFHKTTCSEVGERRCRRRVSRAGCRRRTTAFMASASTAGMHLPPPASTQQHARTTSTHSPCLGGGLRQRGALKALGDAQAQAGSILHLQVARVVRTWVLRATLYPHTASITPSSEPRAANVAVCSRPGGLAGRQARCTVVAGGWLASTSTVLRCSPS